MFFGTKTEHLAGWCLHFCTLGDHATIQGHLGAQERRYWSPGFDLYRCWVNLGTSFLEMLQHIPRACLALEMQLFAAYDRSRLARSRRLLEMARRLLEFCSRFKDANFGQWQESCPDEHIVTSAESTSWPHFCCGSILSTHCNSMACRNLEATFPGN